MIKVVTLLILLSRTPNARSHRACTPNSQFLVNGRLCFCDGRGRYSEAHCKPISRRQSCQPGQIIWNGCNQCICQENGYLLCSNSHCSDDSVKISPLHQGLSIFGLSCTPFRTYYVNCSICVCPASGIATEAQCVSDKLCNLPNNDTDITTKPYCIPNIMHLSSCMQCLCSDQGLYDPKSCADICGSKVTKIPAKCIPGNYFRVGCNLCRCPDNGLPDQRLCISGTCDRQFKQTKHPSLRSNNKECSPHSFTTPRCMYCDCNSAGEVNENVCLELDCAVTNEISKYHIAKDSCYPGEMIPICIQCFCSQDGQIVTKYCSRVCSHQSKLDILENILHDSNSKINIIERSKIERITENSGCTPNALYIDNGHYCLCPENEDTKLKFCTSVTEVPKSENNQDILNNKLETDFDAPCEPNTFVQFDCNTCYCNKNGTIDPKWCTYDDCEAKQLVLESHKTQIPAIVVDKSSGTCKPGTISKLDCNFCICPESGVLREKACTQNDCTEIDNSMYNDKLTCEPLVYYEVDCNICYCPRDGMKNVAKCTKNQCEKSILRSDSCIPGQLFCEECNVCVCPPDGNKMGRACTNHTCYKPPSWELLKLSHSITENHVTVNRTKSLDQCFPGEEFVEGCKLCICTELGLKMYATCESILCEDDTRSLNNASDLSLADSVNKTKPPNTGSPRSKRASADCFTYNVSHSAEREECTPGTFYIIRCKQCICPYFGNINNFCRPLPKNMFCEMAFPYFNYLPMGRRKMKVNSTGLNNTKTPEETKPKTSNRNYTEVKVKHEHTKYNCDKPGTIVDRCFICDCEETLVVIEEHCFRSDALNCTRAKPSFLIENKVDL